MSVSYSTEEMTEAAVPYDGDGIGDRIFTVRGQKVILDSDLAAVYGVEVRALNQQVNRNRRRFPEDFAFYLTEREWHEAKRLGSQNVILKRGQHRKSLPLVFTEHDAIVDILRRIMDLIDPPALPEPPPKKIGFCVKERRAKYGTGSMKKVANQ